jgi:hypothetical protein
VHTPSMTTMPSLRQGASQAVEQVAPEQDGPDQV